MTYDWEMILPDLLDRTLQPRLPLLKAPHDGAYRLFNGFTEGLPALAVDVYAQTIVLFAHKVIGREANALLHAASQFYTQALPWVECVVVKRRSEEDKSLKQGEIVFGSNPAQFIVEDGVTYAVDLLMNQDASFYIDTRNLRSWLKMNSASRDVLNTFAYTGSLGVAALIGGARRVVQTDRSPKFLDLGARSARANGLDQSKMKSTAVDFFVSVGQMKQRREEFDIVILDPPYFSITEKGRVDLVTESGRLINKVRPLVRDGGRLIVVNNALFLGGQDFIDSLEQLGKSGFVKLEEMIPVPQDFVGYESTRVGNFPADPAPFNHPTKIAVLSIKRKQLAE